ncbi:uncharacterized protein FRV6_07843 [Fusarium oxysporum]|uniref:Uncharacterized protein n=1 Tax=Fusarium oxysporum TaxID=5507 RepID=A0A2H3TKG6_FUSOX|nr:uncharacterized protein FRV6_07843 [Fusarium oxysporum]
MPLSNKESECPPSSVTAQVDLIMTGQVPDNKPRAFGFSG